MTSEPSPSREIRIDHLTKAILKLTKAHWERTRTAYYLSKLGLDLGDDWVVAQRELGLKLQAFVLATLTGQLKIIKSPRSGHLGLFPKDAELAKNLEEYFTSAFTDRASTGNLIPRYHPSFWSLFRIPLLEGRRRFITAIEPPRLLFRDYSGSEPIDSAWIEVEKEFVLPSGGGGPEAVLSLIAAWDVKHPDVQSKRFIVSGPRTASRADDGAVPENIVASSQSLLDQILKSMSSEQLKRTSLPLDVVATLSRMR